MSWIRKNPFAKEEDLLAHMVALLAEEARASGCPLSEEELKILANQDHRLKLKVENELRNNAKTLIERLLDKEALVKDPRSFGNSVEWAGEDGYPLIVQLAEEVISERRLRRPVGVRAKRWAIDAVQLVGCGFVTVILIMLFTFAISLLFKHC